MTGSLLLWIGEQRRPVIRERHYDLILDSAINYYNLKSTKLNYEPAKLLLDSGAFTAARQGIELEPSRVLEVQERINPDIAIPLDYPFLPGMSLPVMQKRWERTAQNTLYWQGSGRFREGIMPVLHSWNRSSLDENIRWFQRHIDSQFIAIGTIVTPGFSRYRGFFGDRQPRKELIDMICLALEQIRENSDFSVHITGLGSSPLMLHLAHYLGIMSTDSSGNRRKAAYGKIILPGTAERHISDRPFSFGRAKLTTADAKLLEDCDCIICRSNPTKLRHDWRARALHNEHVLKKEVELAKKLMQNGLDSYEKYLDRIFRHSSLRYLWRYAKHYRRSMKITDFF